MKRPAVIAIIVGAAVTAVLSYPTIVHPSSMARMSPGDAQFSIWNVGWVAHALTHDPRHLFDANIFYPHSETLAYSEANLVAGAIAAIPYVLTRNPIVAYNVTIFMLFLAAFVAMWALVRRLTGSSLAGLVSATGFSFAGCVQSRTAEIQLLTVFVFPLTFLAFHRWLESPTLRRAGWLGASLALAGLACGYYGVFVALSIGVASIWFAPGQTQGRYWTRLLFAIAVAAFVVYPAFRPYLALRAEAGARKVLDLQEAQFYSADARSYLTTPSLALGWVQNFIPEGKEVLFPGLVVGLLACAALFWRGRVPASRRVMLFYVTLALLGAWASFGPAAGLYRVLAGVVPFMSFVRAPARFGVLVAFGLAVVAGFGVAALLGRLQPQRRARTAMIAVAAAAVELFSPWTPLYDRVPAVPEVYQRLATLPRGAVVEFLFPYRSNNFFFHTRFMFGSLWHWQPLINGYSDYIPEDFRQMATTINAFPSPETFKILHDHQARYVIFHMDSWDELGRQEIRDRIARYPDNLRPILQNSDDWLFEIVSWPQGS